MTISSIVEGHGEVSALPVLLRRIGVWRSPGEALDIRHPIRTHRDRFLNRPAEFQRQLILASRQVRNTGWVLVLLDADDDCPAELGATLQKRIGDTLPRARVSVVLANREFEAWFLGAGASLNGRRGLELAAQDLNIEPEGPRNAKGWLKERMTSGQYGETTDQPAFAALMDLEEAYRRCRSFRKLCSEWDRHTQASSAAPS